MNSLIESPLRDKQAQIFPTETCNFKCSGCPYPKMPWETKKALKEQEITPAQWKVITEYLYNQGIRLFCVMGGEPTSYGGIDQVVENITIYPDAFVLLSTSGIHLLKDESLRKKVGRALTQPKGRKFKNGVAVSFDMIPSEHPHDSREFKASKGLELSRVLQKEYGDQIAYVANVMVAPENLSDIFKIQDFLRDNGIFTNLCTIQRLCFGEPGAFNESHVPGLEDVGAEMIRRKLNGRQVVNSVNYLSQLPTILAFERYKCWEESRGSPVIDVAPSGSFRYCNWIGQSQPGGPPSMDSRGLIEEKIFWDEFWIASRETTKMLCRGCSWSRRDRGITPMIEFNEKIIEKAGLWPFNPLALECQNLWVQAQLSVRENV
ncbi:radical SAM protein [Candidatus Gottesmanbacteria bacterium]|nr:radical SAM protein [Candidatus Gottesmanbacteria bacterium]